ncbi:uncharacterized protein LOC143563805 [Bidens hawaiensis]|uniref:uncharacterized protein LOC143563805 n=1 Tax=Bidens hawaiensis TaxID=980011 RepID=UPI004049FE32
MTNTRNQEVDKAIKDHDKAITDIQETLAAMMKQQEQLMKQQEQILKVAVENRSNMFGYGRAIDGSSSKQMRIGKVDFPKFNGEDVQGWLYRCEHFFAIDETPDNLKLRHAVIHLEGDAIQWHRSYMKTRNATVAELPWEEYVRAISSRFSDSMFEDPLEEIASLTHADSLLDYNNSFDALLNKVSISETQAVSGPVKMFKPRTLHEAYGLARIQNNNNLRGAIIPTGDSQEKITPPINASKLPLLPTPTTGAIEPPTSKSGILSSRRLTGDELELKRAKGECFWCTEKFFPGHKCKKKQLYILEVEGEKQATEEDEDNVT